MNSNFNEIKIIHQSHSIFPTFQNEEFGTLSVSLPNILAAESRIKPMARLTIDSFQAVLSFFSICKRKNFHWYIPKTTSKIKYGFISKYPSIINNLKRINARLFYGDDINSAVRKSISTNLGYPSCCIKAHINNRVLEKNDILTTEKVDFLYNNFLNPISSLYFSFHFPCSFQCTKTLHYNKLIFKAIYRQNHFLTEALKYYLSKPVLVFGPPNSFNDFWNSRFVIIFDGRFRNKTMINYKDVYKIIPFENNPIIGSFLGEFNKFYNAFKRNDAFLINENYFELYKNNKLTEKINIDMRYIVKILDFSGKKIYE